MFAFADIEAADPDAVDRADFLLVLNKNENIIPAVAKLEGPQAAAFFMLGETTGTAAGGADEEGKFLRVPGTNPFFPLSHDLQGNRFLELLALHPIDVYLLNTGRVGGGDGDERSKKVLIPHSSAIVKGIAEGTIEWEADPDFGYCVARRDARGSTTPTSTSSSRAGSTRRRGARTSTPTAWPGSRPSGPQYLEAIASLSAEIVESVK